MKEIIKISLSGIAFPLETDAYNLLKAYFDKLERCYATNSDRGEIISDIESRIVELILSKQSALNIVESELVTAIIEQLGTPECDSEQTENSDSYHHVDNMRGTFPRRLYRNPDGAKLGGVFSGLATFFNLDVTLLRIVFFMPLIVSAINNMLVNWHWFGDMCWSVFCIELLLYAVVWIVVPMARTPRQKLEMNGEEITANSIKRTFSRDAEQMNNPKSEKVAGVMSEMFSMLGRLIIFLIKAIAILFGLILLFPAILILIVSFIVIFNLPTTDIFMGSDVYQILGAFDWHGTLALIAVNLLVLIPIAIILWCIIKSLLKSPRKGRIFIIIMVSIWMLALIYTSAFAISNFSKLKDSIELQIGCHTYSGSSNDYNPQNDSISVITTEPVIESDSVKQDTVTITIK